MKLLEIIQATSWADIKNSFDIEKDFRFYCYFRKEEDGLHALFIFYEENLLKSDILNSLFSECDYRIFDDNYKTFFSRMKSLLEEAGYDSVTINFFHSPKNITKKKYFVGEDQ